MLFPIKPYFSLLEDPDLHYLMNMKSLVIFSLLWIGAYARKDMKKRFDPTKPVWTIDPSKKPILR